jgi:MFS family permease
MPAGTALLLFGDILEDVPLMALGMFVFGLGISPLSVVQETIIVRFFKSRGLGVSMALGLLAGKCASFISARTSYSLTHNFGSRAPFYVATFLAALSVIINLLYVAASKWLVDGANAELEASAQEIHCPSYTSESQALETVAARRKVHFGEISRLGNVFWAYVSRTIRSSFARLTMRFKICWHQRPQRHALDTFHTSCIVRFAAR